MIDNAFQKLLPQLPEITRDYGNIGTLAKALGYSSFTFLARMTDDFVQHVKIPFGQEEMLNTVQRYKVQVSHCDGKGWTDNHWRAYLS